MGNIEKISTIERSKLNSEHYFQSLIEQAHLKGLLTEKELEKMQFDCVAIFTRLTEQYNNGDSTSIRIETAQGILASIIFVIGISLKIYQNPDEAIQALQKKSLYSIYQNGREQIDKLIKSSKSLYSHLILNLVETPNVFYRTTIVDGIAEFFKLYRPDFAAEEIHITADYPTYNTINGLAGIEFIKKYLENLCCENDFCSHFPANNIHHLLCGYHKDYQNLLINIFEPVFISALGCTLTHADVHDLSLNSSNVEYLTQLFCHSSQKKINQILLSATDQLGELLSLSPHTLLYLKKNLKSIGLEVKNAAERNTMERTFLIQQYPENIHIIKCSFGDKMDDESYRKIAEEIMSCQTLKEKIDIIKEKIHSLADLEDILLDTELSENDILTVLKELSPEKIAAFMKKYSDCDELYDSDLRSSELLLSNCLTLYFSALTPQQQSWIKDAIKVIHITDQNGYDDF